MASTLLNRFNKISRKRLALGIIIILAVLIFAPIYPAILPVGPFVQPPSPNGFASLSYLLSQHGFVIFGGHLFWGVPPIP